MRNGHNKKTFNKHKSLTWDDVKCLKSKKRRLIENCRWLPNYNSCSGCKRNLYLCEVTKYLAVKRWVIKITVATDNVTAVDHIYYLDSFRVIWFALFLISFFWQCGLIIIIIIIVRHEFVTETDETTGVPNKRESILLLSKWVLTTEYWPMTVTDRVTQAVSPRLLSGLLLLYRSFFPFFKHTLYTYEL